MLVFVLVVIVVVLLEILSLAVVVVARSKAWVCGRSLTGVAGSNPAGVMDVCCERCVVPGRGLYGRPLGRLGQCFSTAGPRPGTGPWHQFYRAARGLRKLEYATRFH